MAENTEVTTLQKNMDKKKSLIVSYLDENFEKLKDGDYIICIHFMKPEKVLEYLYKLDPIALKTEGKKTPFIKTLLIWLKNNKFDIYDDVVLIQELLTQYNDLVHNKGKKFKAIEEYPSPGDVQEAIDSVVMKEKEGKFAQNIYMPQCSYGPYRFYHPVTWGDGEKCFKDGHWCVKAPFMFARYIGAGNLYMVTKIEGQTEKRYCLVYISNPQFSDRLLRVEIKDNYNRPFIYAYDQEFLNGLKNIPTNAQKSDPKYIVQFCNAILSGRWEELEHIVLTDPDAAIHYAQTVIKRRWIEAEVLIVKDPQVAYRYSRDILQSRWLDAEPVILEDLNAAYSYCTQVMKVRWPELETKIVHDPHLAAGYAKAVIRQRWPEAEKYIRKHKRAWEDYCKIRKK